MKKRNKITSRKGSSSFVMTKQGIIKDFNQMPGGETSSSATRKVLGIRYRTRTLPARGPWMAMAAVKGHLSLYMVESATKCIRARVDRRKTKEARPSARLSRGSLTQRFALMRRDHFEVMPCIGSRTTIETDTISASFDFSDEEKCKMFFLNYILLQ